jgi:hypothetical protein
VYIFFFFMGQIGLFLLAYTMAMAEKDIGLLFIGIPAIPLYTAMTIFEARRTKRYISPLVIYLGMSTIICGIVPVWAYSTLVLGYKDIHVLGRIEAWDKLALAHAFGILGSAFFYAGYHLGSRGPFKRFTDRIAKKAPDYNIKFVHWLLIIGIAWAIVWAIVVASKSGIPIFALGHIVSILLNITMFAPFFILISRYKKVKDGFVILPAGSRLWWALVFFGIYIFFNALGRGMRNPIVLSVFFLLWGYFLQRETLFRSRFRSRRLAALVKPAALGLAGLWLIAGVIMPYGKQIARLRAPEDTTREIQLEEYKWYQIKESYPVEGLWTSIYRLSRGSFHGLGICISLRSYLPIDSPVHESVLAGVIPRVLWPDKPYITKGAYFSIIVESGEGEDETTATTATAMSAIGELYWSYGPLGVVAGMFLLGAFYAVTYAVFSANFILHPLRNLVSAFLLVFPLMWFESDVSSVFVTLVYYWVVVGPLSLFNLPGLGPLSLKNRKIPALPAAEGRPSR